MSARILHVFTNDKFVIPYIELLERDFDFADHEVLVIKTPTYPYPVPDRPNVRLLGTSGSRLRRFVVSAALILRYGWGAKKIFVHGLFSPLLVVVLSLQSNLLRKSTWVIWGGDLYQYRNLRKTWAANIYEFLRRKVIRNFHSICSTIDGDFEVARVHYRTRAARVRALYPNPIALDFLLSLDPEITERQSRNILIGNSGDISNCHHDALDALAFLRGSNVDVYCPLGYGGSVSYRDEVIRHGRAVFGERFHPITSFLTFEEYAIQVLLKIDVAVMAHDRQQAVNNIRALAFLGAKIFIRETVSTYRHFLNLHVKVFPYETIASNDVEEFFFFERSDATANRRSIEEQFSSVRITEGWRILFGSTEAHE